MRYELNQDSQVVEYQGDVQRVENVRNVLTELFSQGVYECVSINNDGCQWSICYRNAVSNEQRDIIVYYGNIRNESRNPKEKKIQLNGKDPRGNTTPSIILGIYCYNSSDNLQDLVCAGWNIDLETNYATNPSLRGLNVDYLQKARFYGLYKHSFKNNFVCTFRPELIHYYINNIQHIHSQVESDMPQSDNNSIENYNVIYFGAPGTGKSHAVNAITNGLDEDLVEKVTFHPEYDHASFVGCYKPITEKIEDDQGEIVEEIRYKFSPQVFTNIYIRAWKHGERTYYLVIDEINRGNCAEIFGDLFQLLDRNDDGNSKYEITPSEDLKKYLLDSLREEGQDGIRNGKMRLPSNLVILSTMNTSDQSLYPMDSAFKRRWDWIYVPIEYEETYSNGAVNESYSFLVELEGDRTFKWINFIEKVNDKIKENYNLGADKQIGNYFIKPRKNGDGSFENICLKDFVHKVMFYLWNDVFKDEEVSIFKENMTYQDLFPIERNAVKIIEGVLDYIGVDYQKESVPDAVVDVS